MCTYSAEALLSTPAAFPVSPEQSKMRQSARAPSSKSIALLTLTPSPSFPNRSRFHDKLAETLETAKRDSAAFALMFLDLDQFKRINDTLGHAVGDELLRVIAQRLTHSLRPDDVPGRAQQRRSNETSAATAAMNSSCSSTASADERMRRSSESLADDACAADHSGTHEVFVSASIGIALYPRDGDDLDTLLKNADVAMYHAKAQGRAAFLLSRRHARGLGAALVDRA